MTQSVGYLIVKLSQCVKHVNVTNLKCIESIIVMFSQCAGYVNVPKSKCVEH